jgi:DNA-directed RNA polymerase subunit RPC12/RpoP
MITFRCEHCGKQFRVEDKFAGRQTTCRGCGGEIQIPIIDRSQDIAQPQIAADMDEPTTSGASRRSPRRSGGARRTRTARDRRGEFITVSIFNGLIGIVRGMLAGDAVVGLGRLFTTIGLWSMFGLIAVVAGFQCYVGIDMEQYSMIWQGVTTILLGLVLQYVAARFAHAGDRLIEASPSELRSMAIPDTLGLLAVIFGIVSLVLGITKAISSETLAPVWPGVFQFIGFAALAAIAFNPATVNTHEHNEASAGDEAIGVFGFLLKAVLRLAPIVFGIGVLVATIAGAYHFVMFLNGESQRLHVSKIGEVMMDGFGAAVVPLAAYLVFLFGHLMIDLMRSTLSLLTIRDRLGPPPDGSQQ